MCPDSTSDSSNAQLTLQLPTPLALVISEYIDETSPYAKLHRLVDAAEIVTRFLCVVAISDVYAKLKQFPKDFRHDLLRKLRQPTFGPWVDILSAALDILTDQKRSSFLAELPSVWKRTWLPLLRAGEGTIASDILKLRNHLAHTGRLSDTDARGLLDLHQPSFEEALKQLAFLAEYHLIAQDRDGQQWSLRGKAASPLPPDDNLMPVALEEGSVYLTLRAHSLELFPLHLYDRASHPLASVGGDSKGKPAAMLYLQYDKGHQTLEYTVFDPSVGFAQQSDLVESFLRIFELDTWDRQLVAHEARTDLQRKAQVTFTHYGYGFEDLEQEHPDLRTIKGRSQLLSEVQTWIRAHLKAGGTRYLIGKPGVGKTAFMLGLWERMRSDSTHFGRVSKLRFFFRHGDARCSPTDFYRAATLRMILDYGLDLSLDEDFATDPAIRFQEVLGQATRGNVKPMVFCIDGIDEIADLNPEFVSHLLSMSQPGVIWLISGRTLPAKVRPSDQIDLPPLNKEVVRSWLIDELGKGKYELLKLDERLDDETYRNSFVDALTARAEGLPLYVRHVIDDIKYRRLTVHDAALLPHGLREYYQSLLARLHFVPEVQMLTDVLSVLLVALEPLPSSVMAQVLEPLYGYAGDPQRLLDNALRRARPILHARTTPGGVLGWALYHQSLREYLKRTPSATNTRLRAQHLLTQWCARWTEHKAPYAMRNYPRHLVAKGEWEQLRQLLLPANGSNPWGKARYVQEGAYAGYIIDLKLLEDYALESKDVALLVESRLGQATAVDLGTFLPQLLASLVEVGTTEGRWSMERAGQHLSLMPRPRRAAALKALAAIDDEAVYHELLKYVQGLEDPDERERAQILISQVKSELDHPVRIDDSPDSSDLTFDVEAGLAAAYATFDEIPHIDFPIRTISDDALRQQLTEIGSTADREQRLTKLAEVAPAIRHLLPTRHLKVGLHEALSATVTAYTERVRRLVVLIPHVSEGEREEIVNQALDAARRTPNYIAYCIFWPDPSDSSDWVCIAGSRPGSLARVLPHLSDARREAVLNEIRTAAVEMVDEAEQFDAHLRVGQVPWTGLCQRALLQLLSYLPSEHRACMVELALDIQRPNVDKEAMSALAALLPFAGGEIEPLVLQAADALPWAAGKACVLSHLPPYISERSRAEMLSTARSAPAPSQQLEVLIPLIPQLSGRHRAEAMTVALAAVEGLVDREARAKALLQLAPLSFDSQQSHDLYQRGLALAYDYEPTEADMMVRELAPSLPVDLFGQILEFMASFSDLSSDEFNFALWRIVAHLPERLLPKAFELARRIPRPYYRGCGLASLMLRLPPDERIPVGVEVLGVGALLSRPEWRTALVLQIAPFCEGNLDDEVKTILSQPSGVGTPDARFWLNYQAESVQEKACTYFAAQAQTITREPGWQQALKAVELLCGARVEEEPSPTDSEAWALLVDGLSTASASKLLAAVQKHAELIASYSGKGAVVRMAQAISQ